MELFGRLIIETDDDFGVEFRGLVYFDHVIEIQLFDIADIDSITILKRDGTLADSSTKCAELKRDIERIRNYPAVSFDTTGGNRGCIWFSNV